METARTPVPNLSPKILTDERDILVRSVEKWLAFQQRMWHQTNVVLERQIGRYRRLGAVLRVVVIVMAAGVTTIADIQSIDRLVVTIVAGALTAITGVEGFLKLLESLQNASKQQREIEGLRDTLRFEWFAKVETEPDTSNRL